jgi:hypothetical protein
MGNEKKRNPGDPQRLNKNLLTGFEPRLKFMQLSGEERQSKLNVLKVHGTEKI